MGTQKSYYFYLSFRPCQQDGTYIQEDSNGMSATDCVVSLLQVLAEHPGIQGGNAIHPLTRTHAHQIKIKI